MAQRLARSGGLYVSRYPSTRDPRLPPQATDPPPGDQLRPGRRRPQGGYARLLRREAGFGGEIVSFEPAALSFAALRPAVEVRRLADVFDEVTAHVPDPEVLLKVDTQGYDLEVIEGAAEVLCRVAA